MTIRAVFFDMGGTIETLSYSRELRLDATAILQQRLIDAGIKLSMSRETLYEVITTGLKRYKRWSIESMIELTPRQVWSEYIFKDYDIDHARLAKIAEELSFFVETHFFRRSMRPEMPEVLKAIRQQGLKIGVISNVNSRSQVPVNLQAYQIDAYFDVIVLSSEYGHRKPDPAIFHHAARLANVPASSCLFVGDRVVRDVDGARRAGYGLSVLIRHNFDHGENDDGGTPDAVIENMLELLKILHDDSRRNPPPSVPGKLRGLIFDAGDVLYFRPERGAKFSAFLREQGLETNPNHAQKKKEIEYQAYRGEIDHDEYREAVVGLYGITEPALVARGKKALVEDDANVSFFEGVPETLLKLKEQGYLLGIITDTANPISSKLSWFERGGFGHVWDSIISSMEIGTRKPDPKNYRVALGQLGLDPDQAVFIGHKTSELAGARAVGMHTVAFNYDSDASADYFIERFSDLLRLPSVVGLQTLEVNEE